LSTGQTRDAERYKELASISPAFRAWLNMSSHVRRALRARLRKRDGKNCYYCGKQTNKPDLAHVKSLFYGGDNTEANLRLAHRRCNLLARPKILT